MLLSFTAVESRIWLWSKLLSPQFLACPAKLRFLPEAPFVVFVDSKLSESDVMTHINSALAHLGVSVSSAAKSSGQLHSSGLSTTVADQAV